MSNKIIELSDNIMIFYAPPQHDWVYGDYQCDYWDAEEMVEALDRRFTPEVVSLFLGHPTPRDLETIRMINEHNEAVRQAEKKRKQQAKAERPATPAEWRKAMRRDGRRKKNKGRK